MNKNSDKPMGLGISLRHQIITEARLNTGINPFDIVPIQSNFNIPILGRHDDRDRIIQHIDTTLISEDTE